MTSKILWVGSPTFTNGNVNNVKQESFYENINLRNGQDLESTTNKNKPYIHQKPQQQKQTYNFNGNHNSDSIVYDVPKPNSECIYALPHAKPSTVVDNLVPSAARLILHHKQNNNSEKSDRSDIFEHDFDDDTLLDFSGEEGDFEESGDFFEDQDQESRNLPSNNKNDNKKYNSKPPVEPFNDYEADYGLEVIHEETESQMSSSDSEVDFDSDSTPSRAFPSILSKLKPISEQNHRGKVVKNTEDLREKLVEMTIEDMHLPEIMSHPNASEEVLPEEGVAKHIRISPSWDPEPILTRLYTMQESKPLNNKNAGRETLSGFLNILSGNRRKGTFWNAWKKKFYVLCAGKLNGYEKDNCQDLFQSINLVGGKVDFLDPADFVGTDQSKTMTNRIIGIDDVVGHYYVLQCSTAVEASKWVAALQYETLTTIGSQYAIPLFAKLPSMFKDVILVDFGSTNIRAGVLTHQPTLPALFFASVMSENDSGSVIYGNDVYLRDNRKNAKLKFPFECTSKMCQNNLNIDAVKGFLQKVFKDLKVQPERYRIIINLPRRVDDTCKKNILGLLFHSFQAKGALLCHQSVVSFWAYSSDNGIVCDVGERCDIVPVSQGFVLSHAWGRAPFGGQPLKHSLRQGLGPQENGLYLSTPAENLVLRFISENFIYTSAHSSRKMSQESQEIVVEMDLRDVLSIPNLIGVNQTVLKGVAEGFFDPGMYGLDCDSLPKILHKSLQACGMDIRKEMSQHIFVTGGCTMLPGFVERLELELTKLCPPHLKPKIQASPYRYHASFIGASVLCNSEAFERSLLHRDKYDGGPGPAHWMV